MINLLQLKVFLLSCQHHLLPLSDTPLTFLDSTRPFHLSHSDLQLTTNRVKWSKLLNTQTKLQIEFFTCQTVQRLKKVIFERILTNQTEIDIFQILYYLCAEFKFSFTVKPFIDDSSRSYPSFVLSVLRSKQISLKSNYPWALPHNDFSN